MITWNLINFPDANSPIIEQLLFFHDHTIIIIIVTIAFICYLITNMFINKFKCLFIHEGQDIETVWTMIPIFLLLFIALPSLRLLYLIEENFKPEISVKIIGHQWYWSYEYSNFEINFDSFISLNEQITPKSFRLLEVDNRIVIPFNSLTRFLVSSADVIHAWTIPSLGIKIDAIPGRLNQLNIFNSRPGIFLGQCSEICGANHSFMPIVIESTSLPVFLKWVKLNK